jgi:hypothetical protein
MLFGVSDEIARPRVFLVRNGVNADCDLPWAGPDGKPGCRLVVLRPHLDIRQVTRWTPRRKLFAPFFRISESEFFDVLGGAAALDGVNIARRDDGEGDVVLEALEARTNALRTLVAPGVVSIPVPEKISDLSASLSVSNVAPMLVTLDSGKDGNPVQRTRVSFVIRGTGLGGDELNCFVSGAGPAIEAKLVQLESTDAAICEAVLSPDNAGKLVVAVGQVIQNAVLGGQIEVRKPVKPLPDKPSPSPVLRYEIKSSAGTVEHAVYGPNGVRSDTAERLIRSEIEKSKAPSSQADVSVNVQAPATSSPTKAP